MDHMASMHKNYTPTYTIYMYCRCLESTLPWAARASPLWTGWSAWSSVLLSSPSISLLHFCPWIGSSLGRYAFLNFFNLAIRVCILQARVNACIHTCERPTYAFMRLVPVCLGDMHVHICTGNVPTHTQMCVYVNSHGWILYEYDWRHEYTRLNA